MSAVSSWIGRALTSAGLALVTAGAAVASQGPGAGPGTAAPLTQLAMAVVVYGLSAGLIAAALIGLTRRR
ncbi:MAG TPA: hypothetical protein VGC77_23375 [Rhodopseudomonas sp.]|uniref:hypothetical protein n=1 Tax=Rhodopseudomonas sp. TaxID=1078 RepID=UPI002EDA19D1